MTDQELKNDFKNLRWQLMITGFVLVFVIACSSSKCEERVIKCGKDSVSIIFSSGSDEMDCRIHDSNKSRHTNLFLSPLYNPHESPLWNSSKAAAFAASALDAHSTSGALRQGHVEGSRLDNLLIGKSDPAPFKRQVEGLLIQYGYNFALDIAWRHSHSRADRVAVLATRWGLTGLSLWAFNHNRRMK